jgi:hypothetical protein
MRCSPSYLIRWSVGDPCPHGSVDKLGSLRISCPPETPVLLTTTQAAPIPSPHVAVFASTAAGLHCAMPSQSLGRNRGLGDLDAELEQLAMDLGAPHSGFSKLILRMRSRTSLPICGRPPSGLRSVACPSEATSIRGWGINIAAHLQKTYQRPSYGLVLLPRRTVPSFRAESHRSQAAHRASSPTRKLEPYLRQPTPAPF